MAHENRIAYASGIFHTDFYASMAQKLEPYSIHSYDQFSPSNIDALVAFEMTQQKANFVKEEEQYVDQMLAENPVVVERRNNASGASSAASSSNSSSGSSVATGFSSDDAANTSSQRDTSALSVQQQRADSCRRSRINNKIKKAKLRFRHQFVGMKLEQSAEKLERILDVIRQAEAQLIAISGGCSESALLRLRQQMGVKDYSSRSRSPMSSISTEPQ